MLERSDSIIDHGIGLATPPPQVELQLVWGAEAIAAELGVSARRAYHLLEQREIPARKVGGRWVADKSRLRDFFHDKPFN